MTTFDQLPLWRRFRDIGAPQHIANVETLLSDASSLLDRVIETFPTYTLHNSIHATNVARLMGDLLGDEGLNKIRPLEAAMLLLSAYCHDLGMVFHKNELTALGAEPDWREFLATNPEAFIAVEKKGNKIPLEIAEWYCRSRHADRVFLYLHSFSERLFKWDAVTILDDLGELCRSHNLRVKELYGLETNFLGECDLRFCAILLRLADILDFDGSRSPESVYRFLGLARRKISRDSHSDTEWRKHLASNGFKFPTTRDRRFELTIAAGPDRPAIECDLRKFVDVIEGELHECGSLLETCSRRWRDCILPGSISRAGIKPNGYVYGEYRFTLEQHQILDLLMGENLYEDPYVFVRELLQNAIDTSRHREFVERAAGNSTFEAAPISVARWEDEEGYQWVRFDDFGVGMNRQIVEDFLLKVGRSYYSSAQFQAALIRAQKKTRADFLPISRFGIGLLSCFLAGDEVEIFSVRRTEEGKRDQPIRVSLAGLHGFYTLQMPPLALAAMPSAGGVQIVAMNRDFGTSIAVRIDPRKERGVFNLKTELNRHLFGPPVAVLLDGQRIGGDRTVVQRPWIRKKRVSLGRKQLQELEEGMGYKFRDPLEVELIPLDLTKHSPSGNLRGQLVVARFVPSREWRRLCRFPKALDLSAEINCHDGKVTLKLEGSVLDPAASGDATIRKIAERIESRSWRKDELSVSAWIDISDLARKSCPYRGCIGGDPRWLVHNGIFITTRIPDAHRGALDREDDDGEDLDWEDRLLWFNSASIMAREGIWGAVCLTDSLRPNVSVSRDILLNLQLQVHSAINLAAFRARRAAEGKKNVYASEILNHFTAPDGTRLGTLLSDPLISKDAGWKSEALFRTVAGYKTVEQIRQAVSMGESIELENVVSPRERADLQFSTFMDSCVAALAQTDLSVDLTPAGNFLAVAGEPSVLEAGHKMFPPLTFLPCKGEKTALNGDGILNISHRFPRWLLEVAPTLYDKYPGILKSIRRAVLNDSLDAVNENLKRLSVLGTDVRPPKNVFLSKNDVAR